MNEKDVDLFQCASGYVFDDMNEGKKIFDRCCNLSMFRSVVLYYAKVQAIDDMKQIERILVVDINVVLAFEYFQNMMI